MTGDREGVEEEVYFVTQNPGKPKKAHRVLVMHGLCSEWQTSCSFKFGRAPNTSLLTEAEIDTEGDVLWCTKACFLKQGAPVGGLPLVPPDLEA